VKERDMDQQHAEAIEAGDIVTTAGDHHTVRVVRIGEDGRSLAVVVLATESRLVRRGDRFTVRAEDVRRLGDAEIVGRRAEVNWKQRGHRFYPTAAELRRLPGLYANEPEDGQEEKHDAGTTLVVAHYFTPGSDTDWWVTEYGKGDDLGLVYGYACVAGDTQNAEWGQSSLVELEQLAVRGKYPWPVIVERDLHWRPGPARDVIKHYPY
jgi:hypothetical protein